jgi:hypothetical protein
LRNTACARYSRPSTSTSRACTGKRAPSAPSAAAAAPCWPLASTRQPAASAPTSSIVFGSTDCVCRRASMRVVERQRRRDHADQVGREHRHRHHPVGAALPGHHRRRRLFEAALEQVG